MTTTSPGTDSGAVPAYAMVTGGGTAGHVLPALSIIDGLVAAGHELATLHYVGAQRGVEARLAPDHGVPFTLLDVIGLQRRLDRRNLLFPMKLWRAVRAAGRLLDQRRPRIVVSVGGYASLPTVLAARRRRLPVVVVSYDRRPGRSSQITARFAAASAVAFADSPLPRPVHTGAPVRQSMLRVDRRTQRLEARHHLGVPADRFLVTIVGGSQGSGALNSAVAALVARWGHDRSLALRHVVGERFLTEAMSARHDDDAMLYQVIGFEDQMPEVYAASDVVVSRGGASTVVELAVTGTPAIVVPWPQAAEDHQRANAAWLVEAGAALTLDDAELDRLGDLIDALRADPTRLEVMSNAARTLGEIHRQDGITRLIEELAP
jgi:UDP-N-acetylglucosamine--N-acetylmuramyl-(pentapeptide) pyrophosphoryl-undecaprenol N-acetylglucosamine transferase